MTTLESILLGIVIALLSFELIRKLGDSLMAQVQEVADALNAVAASVQALADAYKAKAAGIDPAALDPLLAAAQALKAQADAALNPGA